MSAARRTVTAEDRLRRLLVMLPWLMESGEVPLADVAARFAMTEAEVVRDLELVAMCGLPPYVDEMIDVFVDDGMVFVGVPRLFRRSLRLTAPEAFSLLAAARTALQLPGFDADGALHRGLERVASALRDAGVVTDDATSVDDPGGAGTDTGDDATAGIEIDLQRPELADAVTDAVADRAELRVSYYSPTRDEVTERTIGPRHVFVDRGNWYLRADDATSGELRTFRIDRIEAAERTGSLLEPPADGAADFADVPGFFTEADVPRVSLRLAPSAMWILERYPHDSADDAPPGADGLPRVDVTLPVASERWLARLLVRLGPAAEVLGHDELAGVGANLAADMLARYR